MLRIRPLLKKENGICPICVLPYVREKRILRVEYFDQAYDMTVWTLRCAECGYEVILPGFARIRNTTCIKGAAQIPSDIMILPLPVAPETSKEDVGMMPDGQPEATGIPDVSGEPYKLEDTKVFGAVETAAAKPMQTAGPAKDADTPETWEGHPITTHSDHAVPVGSDLTPVCSGSVKGQKDETLVMRNVKEVPDAGSQPERKPAPVYGQPGHAATEHQKAERIKEEIPISESHEAKEPKAETSIDEKQKDGLAKERSKGNSVQDKKLSGNKALTRKQEGQSSPPERDHIGEPKKKAAGSQAQSTASGAPPQPMTRDRQAGFFSGGIQSRFSGNGMFRSSPLGTLDALRASVHDDAAQRQKETRAGTKGIGTGQMKPDGAGKQVSAGNGGKGGQQLAPDGNKGRTADNKGIDHRRANSGFSADKQNTAQISVEDIRQILAQKTLSTENPTKQDKKELSAKNFVSNESISDGISAEKTSARTEKQPDIQNAAKDTADAPKPGGVAKPQKQEDAVQTIKADPPTSPIKDGEPAGTGGVPDDGGKKIKKEPEDDKGTEPDAKAGKPEGADNAVGKAGQPASGDTEDKQGPETQEDQEGHKGLEGTGVPEDAKSQEEAGQKDQKKHDAGIASKLQEKIPADLVEKLPVLAQISKQQKHAVFASEQKRFLEQHIPHKQVIINDLIYDTDNSEMFLRTDGRYGLDNPCVHYNYRTKNGNFFRCTVKFKHEDSIRPLDLIEAKRMLEEHPELYKKFFPDSVSDA